MGMKMCLVDANKQLAPLGMPGELLIGGVGLARGYIDHPELTAERFVSHIPSVLSREHGSIKLVMWPAICLMEISSFSVVMISR